MRYCLLLLAILIGIPDAAVANGWSNDEDGTGDQCEVQKPNPTAQRRCWWNFTGTGTGYSDFLVIDQCENYSIRVYPDIDGTETNLTIQALVCGDDAIANVPNSCYVLENATLNGDPAENKEAVYGADGTWLIMDIITACGATANCRVEFACNQ